MVSVTPALFEGTPLAGGGMSQKPYSFIGIDSQWNCGSFRLHRNRLRGYDKIDLLPGSDQDEHLQDEG